MKKPAMFYLLSVFLLLSCLNVPAQKSINWTDKQLIEPADLANQINGGKDLPAIIGVGPVPTIPHAVEIGMVNKKEGIADLKKYLGKIPRDKKIVIYCGCCPFDHCPNIRPAINALKEMKFTNYFLLNLPHNIRKDWIDKGYPVSKS